MGIIATAAKHLMAAGLSGEQLVTALAELEAQVWQRQAEPVDEVTQSAIRMRRYRARREANGMNPNKPEYLEHAPAILERDGHRCVYCRAVERLVMDHIVPVMQGGTDHPDNLATACRECNSAKAGKTPEQWGRAILGDAAREAHARYAALVAPRVAGVAHVAGVAPTGQGSPSPLVPPSLSPAPLTLPPIIPPSGNTGRAADPDKRRGSRLPETWQPPPNTLEMGRNILGFSEIDLRAELERFRDWARAAPGERGRKLDWDATWRNWLRNAADRRKKQGTGRSTAGDRNRAALDTVGAQLHRRDDQGTGRLF